MKILYLIRNNAGANIQAKRILDHLNPRHSVMIASWEKSSYCFDSVDFVIDPIYRFTYNANKINKAILEAYKTKDFFPSFKEPALAFLNSVKLFSPNLIISDFEQLGYFTANAIGIPFWYLSGTHIHDGIVKPYDKVRYHHYLRDVSDNFINSWHKGRTFIYSGYDHFTDEYKIKDDYELITPYVVKGKKGKEKCDILALISDQSRVNSIAHILSNVNANVSFFHPGNDKFDGMKCFNIFETEAYEQCLHSCKRVVTDDINTIYDALFNEKQVVITPKLKDYCEMAHASIFTDLGMAVDVGQVELMTSWGLYEIETSISKRMKKVKKFDRSPVYFHSIIERFANECGI